MKQTGASTGPLWRPSTKYTPWRTSWSIWQLSGISRQRKPYHQPIPDGYLCSLKPCASARMYKGRFKVWGVRKNKRRREKSTITSKPLNPKPSGDSLDCAMDPSIRKRHISKAQKSADEEPDHLMLLKQARQVPRRMGAPLDLEIPEQLLHDIGVYLRGSFDNGQRNLVCGNGPLQNQTCGSIKYRILDLENVVLSALRVSATTDTLRASRAWAYASHEISAVVLRQNIHTYARLCFLVRSLVLENDKIGIARAVLQQFLDLTAARQGTTDANKPMLNLYRGLLIAISPTVDQLVTVIQLRIADILDDVFGPGHIESLTQRILLACYADSTYAGLQQRRDSLERYRPSNIPLNPPFVLPLLNDKQDLSNNSQYSPFLTESIAWLRYMEDRKHHFEFRELFFHRSCLAMCYAMLNRTELGSQACLQALELARNTLRNQPKAVATYLRWLLRAWKNHVDASQIAEIYKLKEQAEDMVLEQLNKTCCLGIAGTGGDASNPKA